MKDNENTRQLIINVPNNVRHISIDLYGDSVVLTKAVDQNITGYLNAASYIFDIPISLLKSDTRKTEVVMARNAFFAFAYSLIDSKGKKKHSLNEIGSEVNKQHSIVIHGIKIFSNDFTSDKYYKLMYGKMVSLINQRE